ncbi:glycine zipper 2TM domain-containing protein [Sphingomonas sp. CFBP8993]|uniref:glycine zipper 2TM domain-containing protein n=1 Tax=Sphingomonas sp. CFBP8993 TaxID=3096526 RepID=UPI002A6B40F6|nr:glycine zipper 2TM domain-containing protein [Sphingomonas sp. CFBP8993]MDY0959856.1 glycine zipper 2TM domain-containing protein [Sphingomonas sp. CFBP8993]
MFKKLSLAAAALAIGATAMVPNVASAQRYYDRGYGDSRAYGDAYADGYNRGPRYDRGYRSDRGYYDQRGYAYRGPQRCNSGTTGTIVGAIAGGLLGRTIDTRGDRTLGTILGGGAGALAGNAIEKSNNPGYCRR